MPIYVIGSQNYLSSPDLSTKHKIHKYNSVTALPILKIPMDLKLHKSETKFLSSNKPAPLHCLYLFSIE